MAKRYRGLETLKARMQALIRRLSDQFWLIIWLWGVVIAILGAISLFLGLYRDPAVYRLLFGPGTMSGDLNIAVVEFAALDGDGHATRTSDAAALSQSMYSFLEGQLAELRQDRFTIEIWPPSRAGALGGATAAERSVAAARLAETIHADIVVYGAITTTASASSVTPEFYIARDRLSSAEELAGAHALGSPIRSLGATDNVATRHALNERMLARAGALAQFIVGLGYFAIDDPQRAAAHFAAADATQGWEPADGKELLLLFRGTAALHQEDLQAANTYYQAAIDINPRYARAVLGLGEVMFHRSRGTSCEPQQTDVAGVERAIALYQQALAYPAPPEAMITAKTAALTGRALLCLTRAGADRRADAERTLRWVVRAYEQGAPELRDLAAEARANLGLLNLTTRGDERDDLLRQRYHAAADEYEGAIALSRRPEWQAYYSMSRVFISLGLGDCAAAQREWERAAAFETQAVRPNRAYAPWRDEVARRWQATVCPPPT